MSPVIVEVEKALNPIRQSLKSLNPVFARLVRDIPPPPIEDKATHARYAKLVEKVTLFLVRLRKTTPSGPESREAIEGIAQYAKLMAEVVEHYEKEHYPIASSDPIKMIQFLMEQHGLSQADLAKEFGGQPVVSAVLSGKRPLNKNQILKLAARFHVSPAVFLPLAKS